MTYSTSSALAARVARECEIDPSIHFVAAAERGGHVYVRGTAGKPEEHRLLRLRAEALGYTWRGARP